MTPKSKQPTPRQSMVLNKDLTEADIDDMSVFSDRTGQGTPMGTGPGGLMY